ncbi:hypothetical protein M3Y98_01062100 [Aphelenchoides besseyi]|nr:hypothetical protein M3Y98_01062100 [Aphelenchoides besseyi]KAI6209691.1 hypothetical protein M3Y96_00247600 [Aphelenchoides besseyi]
MSRILVAVLALAAVMIYSEAITCWVGQKDPGQSPFEVKNDCPTNVSYCGTAYDSTTGELYGNCDLNGFCTSPGTTNISTFSITCCNSNLCNDLNNSSSPLFHP